MASSSITLAGLALGWLTFQLIWGASHSANLLYVYDPDQGILSPLRPQVTSRDPWTALNNPLMAASSTVTRKTAANPSGIYQRQDPSVVVNDAAANLRRGQAQQQVYQQDQYSNGQNYNEGPSDGNNGWLLDPQRGNAWQSDTDSIGTAVYLIPSSQLYGSNVVRNFDVNPETSTTLIGTTIMPISGIVGSNSLPSSAVLSNFQPNSVVVSIPPTVNDQPVIVSVKDAVPQPMGTGPGGPWDLSSMPDQSMFPGMMNDPSARPGLNPNFQMQPNQQMQFPGF